jgi:hypothetical protein
LCAWVFDSRFLWLFQMAVHYLIVLMNVFDFNKTTELSTTVILLIQILFEFF